MKFPGQVRHVEGVRTGIQAQGPRSLPRARVKINPRRKQIQFRADAQRCVVDIQLAKPRNVVHGCADDVEELVEITGFADLLRTFREGRVRVLKCGPCQAALVRVALAAAVHRERRIPDRRLERRLARKPVELRLRARPNPSDVGAHDCVKRTVRAAAFEPSPAGMVVKAGR